MFAIVTGLGILFMPVVVIIFLEIYHGIRKQYEIQKPILETFAFTILTAATLWGCVWIEVTYINPGEMSGFAVFFVSFALVPISIISWLLTAITYLRTYKTLFSGVDKYSKKK